MRPARTFGPAIVALLLLGALAVPAQAHKVRLSPKVGDAASTFVFKGKKWQPGGDVLVEYSPARAAPSGGASGSSSSRPTRASGPPAARPGRHSC
jgi:hypothetical protein